MLYSLNTAHCAYLWSCTTGYQSKIHGSVKSFGIHILPPGTCRLTVHWAALQLSQWVITAFPGTQRPSNLTCLLAEWENPFRLDLRLSMWIIQLVCLIGIGQASTHLLKPRLGLVSDSSPASQRTSTLINGSYKSVQIFQKITGKIQKLLLKINFIENWKYL